MYRGMALIDGTLYGWAIGILSMSGGFCNILSEKKLKVIKNIIFFTNCDAICHFVIVFLRHLLRKS